jgi:hypothetical protein
MYFNRDLQPILAVDSNSNQTTQTEEGNGYGLTVPEIAISVGGSLGLYCGLGSFFSNAIQIADGSR